MTFSVKFVSTLVLVYERQRLHFLPRQMKFIFEAPPSIFKSFFLANFEPYIFPWNFCLHWYCCKTTATFWTFSFKLCENHSFWKWSLVLVHACRSFLFQFFLWLFMVDALIKKSLFRLSYGIYTIVYCGWLSHFWQRDDLVLAHITSTVISGVPRLINLFPVSSAMYYFRKMNFRGHLLSSHNKSFISILCSAINL